MGRRSAGRTLWLTKTMLGRVREISLGEASTFIVGGLDPVGNVGAEAELFVFKGSASGWIDDGVGAVK